MRTMKDLGVRALLAVFIITGSWTLAAAEDQPKPASLSEEQKKAFDETCRALAQSFVENDKEAFKKLLLPKEQVEAVFSPKVLDAGVDKLHARILAGNVQRFTEFRAKFNDLSHFEFSSGTVGYPLGRPGVYKEAASALKNSYFTIALANRFILKVKLEQLVFVNGKCYLTMLD